MAVGAQNVPGMGAPIAQTDGYVTPAWRNFFVSLWNRTGGGTNIVSTGSFIGEIKAYGGATAPASWALCDGSQLSRNTYSSLFDIIGTLYGVGDGSTTFALPDFRGRMILGAGVSPTLTTRTIGETGGEEAVTLITSQMPVHTHAVTDTGHVHTITDIGHNHTALIAGTNAAAGSAVGTAANTTGTSTTGIAINNATTGIALQDAGGTDAVPTLSPFGVANYIIRTM